ncbi:MAG TPA: tetratricopeptide repeat protein [Gammaproteobacteria bacterium]|nr:tetratricopeptide repeat protein [Gammaproteobacteria bacterium]
MYDFRGPAEKRPLADNRIEAVMGTRKILLRGRKKKAEALIETNRLEDARALYIKICAADRRDAGAWGRLARLNWRLGRLAEAESCCRKAIGLQHGHLDAHSVLGLVSMASGKLTEAEQAFRSVLEIDDTRADAYNNLGQALGLQKRPHDAIETLKKALALNPRAPEIHNNLGHTLRSAGLVVESEAAHRRAVELRPSSPAFYSNWLLSLNYLPDANPDRIFQYHVEWGRRFSGPIAKYADYANSRDPERKLCVGYVSPDFRKHPVACFLESILGNHDHAGIQVICYADIPEEDEVTKRLRGYGVPGGWSME